MYVHNAQCTVSQIDGQTDRQTDRQTDIHHYHANNEWPKIIRFILLTKKSAQSGNTLYNIRSSSDSEN